MLLTRPPRLFLTCWSASELFELRRESSSHCHGTQIKHCEWYGVRWIIERWGRYANASCDPADQDGCASNASFPKCWSRVLRADDCMPWVRLIFLLQAGTQLSTLTARFPKSGGVNRLALESQNWDPEASPPWHKILLLVPDDGRCDTLNPQSRYQNQQSRRHKLRVLQRAIP